MTEPTLIHLIRHGAHDLLGRTIVGRTPGVHLNREGRRQAASIAAKLAERPLTALITTPLERTQETAAPLAARLGQSLRLEPDLTDLDFGAWTMVSFSELDRDPRWHDFNQFRSVAAIPGGESMVAVQTRAVAAIRRLATEFVGAEIAVFSHGDVIKSIVMHSLGISLDMIQRIEISPGSRSMLAFGANGAKLLALNLPASAPVPI